MSKRPPCWRCTAVLLLVACILPFALLLRTYKSPSASTIDRVYGVVLALGGLALLAARALPGLTSPLVLSIAFAAPLFLSGAGYCRRRTPGAASACRGDLVGSGPAARCDPGRNFPARGPIGRGASAPAAPDRGRAPVHIAPGAVPPGGRSGVAHGRHVSPRKALEPCGTTGRSMSARPKRFWAGRSRFGTTPCNMEWGPTLLLAALCRGECWTGTYIAVAATNLLYLLAMGGCVVMLTRKLPMGLALVALAAMGCAILMWTGYPPDFKGPIATPSVDGMRFFPLAALLFFIMAAEERGFRLDAAGHALWFLGVVWSPEAAFYATVVWWPYLALRRAQAIGATSATGVAIAVLRGAGVALAATAAGFRRPGGSVLDRLSPMAFDCGLYDLHPQSARNSPGQSDGSNLARARRGGGRGRRPVAGRRARDPRGLRLPDGSSRRRLLLPGAQPRQQCAQSPAVRCAGADGGAGDRLERCRLRICAGRARGPGGVSGDVRLRILGRRGAQRPSLEYRAKPFHQRHTPGHPGVFRASRREPREFAERALRRRRTRRPRWNGCAREERGRPCGCPRRCSCRTELRARPGPE